MKFSPINNVEVTLENEEMETIRKTQKILSEIIDEMLKTSLNIAECQDDEGIYNLDKEVLLDVLRILDYLQYIQNIC